MIFLIMKTISTRVYGSCFRLFIVQSSFLFVAISFKKTPLKGSASAKLNKLFTRCDDGESFPKLINFRGFNRSKLKAKKRDKRGLVF